jgi:glutamine phosphoribosylpyrophosphate amidotransferase
MCSIIGSFDKDTIVRLCELNAHRGQHSHSISYYDNQSNYFCEIHRGMGPINYDNIDIPGDAYCVVHMQAPTTDGKSLDNIHPAMIGGEILWHNGIIKEKEIHRLQEVYKTNEEWDTYILLKHMMSEGSPDGIDGSFSCLYFDSYRMYLFRNEIAPMFIDDDFNISSTKFPKSHSTEPNSLLLFEPGLKRLVPILNFNTVENPYYFGE